MGIELGGNFRIIFGIDDDRHIRVVLRGAANHGRAADVDILDASVERGGSGEHLLERVEVDDEKIDGFDAMRQHGRLMLGIFTNGEEPAMHLGMQGLEPSIHHLRKAGQLRHIGDLEARLLQRLGGAARRDERDAAHRERARQGDEPRLVRDRKEGARHAPKIGGHERMVLSEWS